MPITAQRCAERLLVVAPALMQALRVEMRAGRNLELSVPQFRTLLFFQRRPDAPLTNAAEHLGLSLAAASRLAMALEKRGLLKRGACPTDRRRMAVTLTPAGVALLAEARGRAAAVFAKRLENLSATERDVLFALLGALQTAFDIPGEERPASPK